MYLNQYLRSVLEEGYEVIYFGDIVLELALDASQSPNNTEYRQNVFPGLSSWQAKVFSETTETKAIYMMAKVKEFAIKKILELREMNNQPKVSVASIKRDFVKPVIKAKTKVKSERTNWKKLYQEVKEENRELNSLISSERKVHKQELREKNQQILVITEEKNEVVEMAQVLLNSQQARLNEIRNNNSNQQSQSV